MFLHSFRSIMPFLFGFGSAQFRRWIVDLIPFEFVQKPRRIVDFIDRETRTILETKKRALEQGDKAVVEQVGEGRDILSTLCGFLRSNPGCALFIESSKVRANMAASNEDRISDEEVMAHISYAIILPGAR